MPLWNPLASLRRRTTSTPAEPAGSPAASPSPDGQSGGLGGIRRLLSKSPARSGGGGSAEHFRFKVPQGCEPGQEVRVKGPNGRQFDITIPPGAQPGQVLLIKVDGSGPRAESAGEAMSMVKALAEETRSRNVALQRRLSEELEMQKAVWASAKQTGAEPAPQLEGFPEEQRLANPSDFSQTQAIVFFAAEDGDCAQLVAAVEECSRFCEVERSFKDTVRELKAVEDAFVTWQCLLTAIRKEDRHEVELWSEQARSLDLSVPPIVSALLQELMALEAERLETLRKQRLAEENLQAATAEGDLERMARMASVCEELGMGDTAAMKEASERLKRAGVPFGKAAAAGAAAAGSSSSSAGAGASASASAGGYPQQAGNEQRTDTRRPTVSQLEFCTAKELIEECRRRCLDTAGCVEREDLLRLLHTHITSNQSNNQGDNRVSQAASWRSNSQGGGRAGSSSALSGAPSSVWDRRKPPPQLISRRGQCLYLLGLETKVGRHIAASELRNAYRRAAMESHPDRMQNHEREEEAKELFQKVKEAFDYLNGNPT